MLNNALLSRLMEYTTEEKRLLRDPSLDLSNYNRDGETVMDPSVILPNGELFGIRKHTRFVDFPRHGHWYVEGIYQIAGQSHHIMDGIKPVHLMPGQLLLIGRGTEHEIKASDSNCIAMNLILIPAFFDSMALRLESSSSVAMLLKNNLGRQQNTGIGYLLYDLSTSLYLQNLLENLIQGQYDGISLTIQQLTLELILQHLSLLSEKLMIASNEQREYAIVMNILARMENQVRLNLTDIAAELQLDVPKLSRMIQKHTGASFTALLHTARFSRAVTLLRDTDLAVADIALAVGYENTAFFYRRFQKLYHCTPAVYRKILREKDGKGDKTQWI